MAKSWRPDGWKNPYPTYENAKENPFSPGDKILGNTCGFDCEYRAFEAGADAMLEALRKNQWCPFDKRVMQANFRGKVVIIPDDEEVNNG